MSEVRTFELGGMKFEAVVCIDPSTSESNLRVFRVDIPRKLVATGRPDELTLTPAYSRWDDELGVLEQAVMDSLTDAEA